MSLHKLSAGDGYQYLVRQTAAADQDLTGRQSLSDYYTEKGERPGHWFGRGLSHLEGVNAGATVDGDQMRSLFGEGRHPNAEALERAVVQAAVAAGREPSAAARQASAASALGRKFAAPSREGALAIACSRAYEAYNVEAGQPRNAAVPDDVRTEIRTTVARQLFEEKYGRPPAPGGRELSGFMARESRPAEQACAGYDLTFSPVKSVSTLWAIADRGTAAAIEEAHQAAVKDTIEWLEKEVIYTRRGAGGVRTVDVDGVIAAAFLHRDARSGDPDLHTHVAIANKVRDPSDGAWLAIDGQVLYKHTVAASERYNARLEAELSTRLGVRWAEATEARRDAKRAVREIVGVPRDLMQRWSQRRTAIDAQLAVLTADFRAEHGRIPSTKEMLALAQEANLATREAKHEHRSEAEQREQWRREAVDMLGAEEAVDGLVSSLVEQGRGQRAAQRDVVDDQQLRTLAASVLARVIEDRATFQRPHVTAEALRQVRALQVAPAALDRTVRAVVDLALSGQQLAGTDDSGTLGGVEAAVALGVGAGGSESGAPVPEAFARADGTSQYSTPGAALFTTTSVLAAEQTVVAAATEETDLRVPRTAVAVALMEEVANGGVDLNAGQRALVDDFVTGGARVRLAVAPAGTGKTTAMRAAASAWRHNGGGVLALAPSAAAATVLGDSIGARADTLAKLRYEILNGASPDGPLAQVQPGTMIVVDEAGMACARDLAVVVEAAQRRGAVVRLIGDDQQLAAIGAGGVLRDIEAAAGANRTLVDVVRFKTAGEAEASLAMREGHAEEALGWLLDNDRVRTTSTTTATDDVFTAWRHDVDQGLDALMIAATNDDVTALNRLARLHRLTGPDNAPHQAHTSPAGPPAVALAAGLEASAGDTIVTRRNERTLTVTATDFVKNGDRWTVQRVLCDGGLRARHHGTGRTITLPADYVARDVDLGYATTVYGAQGQTVDTTHALIDGREDRQAAYVALTRGRACNTAHVVASGDGNEHNMLRPENLQQRSAAETLYAVLRRDGSATSATSTHRDETSAPKRLAAAVAVHLDATARAAELQLGADAMTRLAQHADQAYAEASGVSPDSPEGRESAVGALSESRSWQHLSAWLALRDLEDGPGAGLARLRPALIDLPAELDGRPVADPAALVLTRLQRSIPAGGPLPWLPPVPEALRDRLEHNDPVTAAWLARRVDDVREQAADVAGEAATWTHENAPAWAQPYLPHSTAVDGATTKGGDPARALVADLAVWRAAHDVPEEDLRPAGPRPTDRAERTHYTRLLTRATRLQPRAGGRSADAWARRFARLNDAGLLPALGAGTAPASTAALDALVSDPWWPVLAARLEDLAGDVDTWAGAALRDAAAAAALSLQLENAASVTQPTTAADDAVPEEVLPVAQAVVDQAAVVDQLLIGALAGSPLPDEHAAAALWTRLYAALNGARRSAAMADRLLVERLGPERAVEVAATHAWAALRDLARTDADALVDALDDALDVVAARSTDIGPDAYAAAILAETSPAGVRPADAGRRHSALPSSNGAADAGAVRAIDDARRDPRKPIPDDEQRPRRPRGGPRM
ncbi:MobF family relaxase [Nocardioides sp. ChNu-99]|uniref:MobF family relaxase n=1 Tax=Nocardioides sp. ChNu-99 TaxID=2839897 RepID=UPI00240532EC|nr:MobF family relaxase [Nocardioides sp. ChNu-99]